MKKSKLFFLGLFSLLISALYISCSDSGLKSDNYWNGSEKELEWVKDNTVMVKNTQDRTTTENSLESKVQIPEPRLTSKNDSFKIAVVVSGDYWEFYDNLKGLIDGFSNIGWANQLTIPSFILSAEQLIQWVSEQDYSDYIKFDTSLFYNLEWGDNMESVEKAFAREKPDADIIIAYGGMAAKFFYKYEDYPIPVIADAITDPFGAEITLTEDDSGKDFFSCKVDTEQFRQQIKLFHYITGFKKLGIVYGDDEFGLIYGAVRDVEEVANELGFELVRNTNVKEEMEDDTVDLYLAALKDVASRSDAVYIGASTAVTEYDIIPQIVEILDNAKVPSFALEGSIRVKDGILLSLASSGTIRSGIYTATKIVQIFDNTLPRNLIQRFESIPSVAVNLATADIINFEIPVEIIIDSDEVYRTRDGSPHIKNKRSRKQSSSLNDFMATRIQGDASFEPQKRQDGLKYRIGVLLSGSYWEFDQHFNGLLEGFISLGWAKQETLKNQKNHSVEQMISNLNDFSDFITFVPEYCIDLKWGDNIKAASKLFSKDTPNLDLIIAFGGVAGNLFSSYKNYPIPVLMEGITDPVGSGFIYSADDSGKDFLTCRIDPGQYQRQVKLFHDFVGFKKLGIIYGDDEYGKLYGAVHDVERVARKQGFSIVRNTNVKEKVSPDTVKLYLDALKDLCTKVDAVYLGASTALTEYDITDKVSQILIDAQIPSFALEGEIRVTDGIMLGVSSLEAEKFGLYNAKKIISIFNGVPPRMLNQVMEGVPSIALNMKTARKINKDISLSVLSSVDTIFY